MPKKPNLDCQACDTREIGVFCNLSPCGVENLNAEKNANLYKKGQNLFLEGNPPFGLYCINSGKIKVTKVGKAGRETIVRIATKGDLLGHRSLFSDSPYSASATVIEDAKVCFINKGTILKLIADEPKLSMEILASVSKQMGAAEEKVASLSQKSVRERFAELLLLLNQSFGEKSDEGQVLNVKLTREEMASMVGTASENLIRLIKDFKNEEIIDQKEKSLILKDIKRLEKIAGLEY